MRLSPPDTRILATLWLASLVSLADVGAVPAHPRDAVAFYIDTYGKALPEDDPQVAKAHAVFQRVRAVADKNSKRLPKLVVVGSRSDPWAIALPDGHIVLSKAAVALCHRRAGPREAEARLAFVLGHELAHLAHDDFWHHEVYGFLASHTSTRHIARFLRQHRQAKKRELAADDQGFIYAAMAGYAAERLIEDHPGKRDFFTFWTRQTHTRVQSSDGAPQDRAALLRRRLQALQEKLGFFDFGVRLSHFDYCDDGLYFFDEFRRVFPGREVLNNLGFCYLQLARQEMGPERAYFYWMPLLLDGETRAAVTTRRGAPSLKTLRQAADRETAGYLNEALENLQRAIEADPSYVPARVNLAVAELYGARPHRARAILAEARDLAPDDLTIAGLEALALYEQSEARLDLWPAAVEKLERLAAKPEAPPSLRFNLARLLAVRPRQAEAQAHWDRLAEDAHRLPAPIATLVCREQTTRPYETCVGRTSKRAAPLPWQWPLPVSGLEPLSREVRARFLTDWEATAFDWFKPKLRGHIYQHPDKKAEVLELDGFVQMQTLKGGPLGTVQDLPAYCAQPLRRRVLAQGTVWSCDDWAALVRNDSIEELWWVAK